MADCLLGLAANAITRGDAERAARLLGVEETMRGTGGRGAILCPCTSRAAVIEALASDATQIEAALTLGRAMPLDAAISYALEEPA